MMYFTTNSFPYVGSGWKEPRLSLSAVIHLPGKTGYHAATRHNPEGYIVAQRMHGYALAEVCLFCGGMDGAVQLPRAERIHRIEARKQPSALEHATLRVGHAPPDTQALEQDRREHRVAVAAALALLDAQRHALAVDVADLQRHHFARTQPGTVGDRQCRLVLQVAGCGDQAGHLVRAEHDR